MSDLTEAFDRALQKFIDAGHFTAEQIAGEEGKKLLHSIKWDQRQRLSHAVPGLMKPADFNVAEQSVLWDLQKSFNDVAGINDVRPLLEEAAAETLGVIAARGASPALAVPADLNQLGDGLMKAANAAVGKFFSENMLWSQCFGFDKAPDFNHNVYSALQMRFLGLIPGLDVKAEQLDYDKKVVRNIHEVNSQPGLNDVRRILDSTADAILAEIGLKSPERMAVPKTLQIKAKGAGP